MTLTPIERHTIEQFLGGAWYDRSEEDDEIVAEWVELATATEVGQALNAIAAVLARVGDREELTNLIRDAAWRWFPTEASPITWLHEVHATLTSEATRQGKLPH